MRGQFLGGLGIFLHAFPFIAAGQTPTNPQLATWNQSASGSWTDSSRWSTAPYFPRNDHPAGVRYAAEISAGGTPYVVTIDAGSLAGKEITVDDFLLNASDATVWLTRDTFTVVDSFTIDAGTFQLDGGTIRNSTIGGAGGEFSVRTSGTLDNVTLARTMQVTAPLTARNNLTLDGGVLQFAETRLDFAGTQQLTGTGEVQLFTEVPNHSVGMLRAASGTLTIDAGIVLDGGGHINFGAGGIINDSTIRASSAHAWMRITNDPSLTQQFHNRGVLEATAGGTLHLESGNWKNDFAA